MQVMENIRDVRMASDETKDMFDPLQKILVALKSHGVDITGLDKVGEDGMPMQDYLDEAPLLWDNVEKKMFRKKEDIMPLQLREVDLLKAKLEEFYLEIRAFRNDFRKNAPFIFSGSPNEAYEMLDKHAVTLSEMEEKAKAFNGEEELFELVVSKYVETSDTRTELKLLKFVWDMKALVLGTYESWNPSAWNDIKTEELEDINKALMKNLKKMANDTPVVKGWKVFRDIEDEIKNMNVILPMINDLHSPAMRDRHWKALAKICKVKNIEPHDPKFTFEDTVKLKLHLHGEDVEDVIDTAAKELKIERKLSDIEKLWRVLELDYVAHNDSEMFLIKPSEEVIEGLEGHQLELQTMIGMGKFVEFFKDRVLQWQQSLGLVEDVLKVWTNVSRNWASLESIFLASADIRSQLPDDTKRFEGLDGEFKELMKDAVTEPNVLTVCSVDGRLESLQSMMQRLEQCQKSLNEYLDQKKKIFLVSTSCPMLPCWICLQMAPTRLVS